MKWNLSSNVKNLCMRSASNFRRSAAQHSTDVGRLDIQQLLVDLRHALSPPTPTFALSGRRSRSAAAHCWAAFVLGPAYPRTTIHMIGCAIISPASTLYSTEDSDQFLILQPPLKLGRNCIARILRVEADIQLTDEVRM